MKYSLPKLIMTKNQLWGRPAPACQIPDHSFYVFSRECRETPNLTLISSEGTLHARRVFWAWSEYISNTNLRPFLPCILDNARKPLERADGRIFRKHNVSGAPGPQLPTKTYIYHARTQARKTLPFRGFCPRKTHLFQPKSLILRSNKTSLFKARCDCIFIK